MPIVPDKVDLCFPICYTEYINQNSFYARLFSHSSFIGMSDDLHTTLLTHGIAALQAALEETMVLDSNSDGLTPEIRKAHLLAAVQWITHAGPQLFDEIFVPGTLRIDSQEFTEATRAGPAYKASVYGPHPGINFSRWMYWKTALHMLSERLDLGKDIAAEMKKAAGCMECIEADGWLMKSDQAVMLAKSGVDAVNGRLINPRKREARDMTTEEGAAQTSTHKLKRARIEVI
jgi:hypothetical protein